MTEWARQCRSQGGLVVFPHFPNPRAENAATLIHGDVDAVEMCSWGDLYRGIDPYSLSDWYRYLAEHHGIDQGNVSRRLPLAFLAPDIVEAILQGRQPIELTAARMLRIRDLPLSWAEQRQRLGIAG